MSKFIDTAATKTITMKLRKTQVGQELLRMSNWISQDSWRDMWSVQDIIAGLKEAYVRPSAQLYAEIDDIWDMLLGNTTYLININNGQSIFFGSRYAYCTVILFCPCKQLIGH